MTQPPRQLLRVRAYRHMRDGMLWDTDVWATSPEQAKQIALCCPLLPKWVRYRDLRVRPVDVATDPQYARAIRQGYLRPIPE